MEGGRREEGGGQYGLGAYSERRDLRNETSRRKASFEFMNLSATLRSVFMSIASLTIFNPPIAVVSSSLYRPW